MSASRVYSHQVQGARQVAQTCPDGSVESQPVRPDLTVVAAQIGVRLKGGEFVEQQFARRPQILGEVPHLRVRRRQRASPPKQLAGQARSAKPERQSPREDQFFNRKRIDIRRRLPSIGRGVPYVQITVLVVRRLQSFERQGPENS
jgi:hypothetical protein